MESRRLRVGVVDAMAVGALFGPDPAGVGTLALCVLLALALFGLIAGGFALLSRLEGTAGRVVGRGPHELGVLALWRLGRVRREGPALSPPTTPDLPELVRRP